jgi:ABC-type arginine/histidine transport system permease subunit
MHRDECAFREQFWFEVTQPEVFAEAVTRHGFNTPSAFRRALPAYSNEVIFMLHGSAIASVITIVDITGAARIVNSRYFSPYEAFVSAAIVYLCLTFLIVGGFRLLEQHWFAHLRPREETAGKGKAQQPA